MRFASVLFFIFLFQYAHAQDTIANRQERMRELFIRNHISFSLIPLITEKARVESRKGPYTLGSKPVRGVEVGFNYHLNFDERYSIIYGIHGGISVRNYSLFVPKEDFTPQEDEDFYESTKSTQTVDFYLSFPVFLERRWRVEKGFWNLQTGANIRFYPDQFSETISHMKDDNAGSWYDIILLELEVGRNHKPWIDYNLAGGYGRLLKNNNFIRLNLIANFSKTSITRGSYLIHIPGQVDSEGSYASRHSYIGLALSYMMGNRNKIQRRQQQYPRS